MNTAYQTKILDCIASLRREYAQKKRRYDEVYMSASSASISSGGGSKSYTNHDLVIMREELSRISRQIGRLNRRLVGLSDVGVRHVVTVRS